MNFVYLDNEHILHKEGIIININNLKIIQPTYGNKVLFNGRTNNMAYLMIKHFYNADCMDIKIENIYHMDDNYYNNSIDNIIYKNNNTYKQNIYNNLVKYKYIICIEKYDINLNIKHYSNLIKNCIFSKDLIIKLLNSSFVIYKDEYWKMNIKKIKLSDLNNCSLYTAIPDTYFYISNDRSYVINYDKILLINIDKDYQYYSNVYSQIKKKFQRVYLDFYNFIDIPFELFNKNKFELNNEIKFEF
jgi:hypothetical protein